jgi:tRNA1(Val) A37 N6-methylase TrmN6
LQEASTTGLYEFQRLEIRHTPLHLPKRVIVLLSKIPKGEAQVDQLTIKNENGQYTDRFKELLADFYLDF